MKESRKKQIIFIFLSSAILLAFASFSYFITAVGNQNRERVNTSSARISLTYTDCAESSQSDCANINKNLVPGESVTKTFRVENTGTVTANFDIVFKSVENTFVNNELVYTVYNESNEVIVGETPVPAGTSTEDTIFSDSIAKNTTKNYNSFVQIIFIKYFIHIN